MAPREISSRMGAPVKYHSSAAAIRTMPRLLAGERVEAAGAIELPYGDQVEEVDDRAEVRDHGPDVGAGREVDGESGERGSEAVDGAGETDARIGNGRHLDSTQLDECAEAGDEHRGAGREP